MTRRSIDIESFQHGNPIPAATRIGPLVVSSITPPFDPGSRNVPDTLEAQIDNLFTHVGQMLDGAGATWDDMAKMTFYVTDPARSREALNGPWLERFPDPASRPSRHNMKIADEGGPVQISCTFVAYVED
jgi:2-iminobutanoate/2-iminopropanoate deaminase